MNTDVTQLLKNTSKLPPLQRIVLVLYAVADSDSTGTVEATGTDLAEQVGMSRQLFSRVRRELIAGGWLEEDVEARFGKIRFYRLTRKCGGPENAVISLDSRRAS